MRRQVISQTQLLLDTTMARVVYICLLLVLLQVALVYTSIIRFSASPDVIKDGLTDSLTLRCSLNDSSASSNIIGKRDVTETPDNVAEVTTIVLMRDGGDIASISRSQVAKVMDGSTNSQVSGSVAGRSGDQAYLEMTLHNPLSSQLGEFVCEINAVITVHTVTFSTSVEVTAETPSISDMILTIHDLKTNEKLLKDTIARLNNTIASISPKSDPGVFFSAGLSKDMNVNSGQVVKYDNLYANVGNAYNPSTGIFTCSVSGYYHFEMNAMAQVGLRPFRLRLYQNDKKDFSIAASHSYNGASNSGILKLSQGDVVRVVSEPVGGSRYVSYLHGYDGGIYTSFNGQLLMRT